jgi:hypothetical protein
MAAPGSRCRRARRSHRRKSSCSGARWRRMWRSLDEFASQSQPPPGASHNSFVAPRAASVAQKLSATTTSKKHEGKIYHRLNSVTNQAAARGDLRRAIKQQRRRDSGRREEARRSQPEPTRGLPFPRVDGLQSPPDSREFAAQRRFRWTGPGLNTG